MKTKNINTKFKKSLLRSILLGIAGVFVLSISSLYLFTSPTFARENLLDTQGAAILDVEQDQYLQEESDLNTPSPSTDREGRIYVPSASNPDKAFPYTYVEGRTRSTTDIGKILNQTNQGGSLLEKYLDLFDINYSNENGKAIAYVQVVINYVLALLGIISVVLIMYSFYSIFLSSKSEEAISNAQKTVIGASVGLILVGLSAYIVNFIFYIYNKGL